MSARPHRRCGRFCREHHQIVCAGHPGIWKSVLFEDENLLALDKPSGLLSPRPNGPMLRWRKRERPNLMRLLYEGIAAQKPWAKQRVS